MLIWFSPYLRINGTQKDCIIELLAMRPNSKEAKANGVRFEVGSSLREIEYLDRNWLTPYFNTTILTLKNAGYSTIRSLAYDSRFIPENIHEELFPNWTRQIEADLKRTGKKPIVICHSLGCKLAASYILHLKKEKVEKLISAFIMIAGPFGGSVTSVLALTTGYDFHLGIADLASLRRLAAQLPSTYYLLPNITTIAKGWNLPTDEKAALKKIKEHLEDFDHDRYKLFQVFERFKKSRKIVKEHLGNVPAVCFYGETKGQTLEGRDKDHKMQYGDGDGVVNIDSLRQCSDFTDYIQTIPDHNHMSILYTAEASQKLLHFMDLVGKGQVKKLKKNW